MSINKTRSGNDCLQISCVVLIFALTAPFRTQAQGTNLSPPLALSAEEDRARIMGLLGIDSLPPGASGSDPATYDESVANPYPQLPPLLVTRDGARVTSARTWIEERRPEILEDFAREVYGRVPEVVPTVAWEVLRRSDDGTTITKDLVGRVDNRAYRHVSVEIDLVLVTPSAARRPAPIIMQLGFPRGSPFGPARVEDGPTWQEQVLAKGWGYAIISPSSIQPDNGAGLTRGVIGLANQGRLRDLDDWGALRAWAWGASRALDYFAIDADVDARRVGVQGHSRYGKAAIVAMAFDQRFAIAYISSSGAGGAKLHRRRFGELIENVLAANEYHWMAGNYFKYGGHWDALPVDSHSLISLIAPRPVFISAGNDGDLWVDPKGSFLAAAAATPVYELLGKRGVGVSEFPAIDTPLIEGDVGFHQHTGGHTAGPTWPTFLTFAERYLDGP